MRKTSLRYCGTLGGLLAPLFLNSCEDNANVCDVVTQPDGATEEHCHEIGNFGKSTLAQESPEPAGDNCQGGGKRIDTGFDDNDNGQLDPSEIDVSAYICDGDVGPRGASGANSIAVLYPEDPGSQCANGGVRVDFGLDVDGNGELAAEEVGGSRYVCHGIDGLEGANGARPDGA
jgi:hypothetical protein